MDKETRPAKQSPSADEAALLFVDEARGNETGNGNAVQLRGAHVRRGGLGQLRRNGPVDDNQAPPGRRSGAARGRVPHHGPALREVDPAIQPVQVRRTYRYECGHPHVLCRLRGLPPRRDPRIVVVSSVSSGQNIAQHDTPASKLASALALSRGWEWLPHHVTKDRHPRISGLASAAKRDATVDGVYLAAPIGGDPGLVIVVDDFCTRGATLGDIARAIRESNPGWKVQGASLAKVERAAYWKGELTNAHIPDSLDAIWRWDPGESPFH